ncbi:MAG TPA: hypothetical protein VGB01_05175 [candidate division Zixibacteria bacterium]
MLEDLDSGQKYIIYSSFVYIVKSNSGIGFLNEDQGHPAYILGRESKNDYEKFGDSPEKNELYKMMKELSEFLKDSLDFSRKDLVFSWSDFCKMATDAYNKQKEM